MPMKDKIFYQKTNDRNLKIFSGDIFFPSVISISKEGTQFNQFLKTIDCDMAILGSTKF
jgi:hypothetical protein